MKASGKTIRRAPAPTASSTASTALASVAARSRNTGARWMMAIRDMASDFPGQYPLLADGDAIAQHHERAVQARATYRAVPAQLAVLLAFGQGLEGDPAIGGRDTVGAVAVAVAVARGRTESPVFEDQRVGIAAGLAAFEHDPFEA